MGPKLALREVSHCRNRYPSSSALAKKKFVVGLSHTACLQYENEPRRGVLKTYRQCCLALKVYFTSCFTESLPMIRISRYVTLGQQQPRLSRAFCVDQRAE